MRIMTIPRRRPSRHTKAKDTIAAFATIKDRLRIDEAFDYEAQGLPCPAEAYLDSFESDDSRRTMGYALDIFAAFLSGGGLGRDQIPCDSGPARWRRPPRRAPPWGCPSLPVRLQACREGPGRVQREAVARVARARALPARPSAAHPAYSPGSTPGCCGPKPSRVWRVAGQFMFYSDNGRG